MKTKVPLISLGWKEGKLADLWSFVHFLSGMLLAIILVTYINLPFIWAFGSAFFLFLLWEAFELLMRIGEHIPNSVSDIVVGCVGFLYTFYFLPLDDGRLLILIIIFILLFDILGMRAYINRSVL